MTDTTPYDADPNCNGCGEIEGCYWSDELSGDCGVYWSVQEGVLVDFDYGGILMGSPSSSGLNVRCVRDGI